MATAELQQTAAMPSVAMAPRALRTVGSQGLAAEPRTRPAPTPGPDFGAIRVRPAAMAGPSAPPGDGPSRRVGAPSTIEMVLASPGQPLPAAVRSIVEPRFGRHFDEVRIHTDDRAAEASRALDANAWAFGSHIAFGDGRFDPASRRGLWLLSHELAHTVQQSGVPGPNRPALAVSPDAGDRAADLAADAVMAGRAVPSQPRWQGIQRQRVTSVDRVSDDERVGHLDNGTRLRVKRVRWVTSTTDLVNWARLTPGIDEKKLWLDIDWCAGQNRGTVQLGANIPEQVLKTILGTVTSGGDIDAALRGVTVTPYVQATILQSGSFRVTASGQVTIDRTGAVTGGGGRVGVSTGPVDVDVQGSGTQGGGWQVGGSVTVTPGRQTQQQECRVQRTRLVHNTRYECTTQRDIAARSVTERVSVTDRRQRFVYFEYARDAVSARSATTTTELGGDLRDGFQVSGIRGFTSPEGPVGPGRRFMGNEELARRRAVAAAGIVEAACRMTGGTDTDACFVGGRDAVSPTGQGELYTLTKVDPSGSTQEVEGAPLAEHAAAEFLSQPAEESHRTPEIEARLRDPSTTPAERADLVYPLLRRAEITLVRSRTGTRTREEPARTESTPSSCPPEVIRQIFPPAEQVTF